jgi:hypothetical protein
MRDAGYILAGYLLTGGVVAGYAASVALRLRRLARRAERGFPDGGIS